MCEIENKKENVMLNPAETAQAVSNSMEHKAHTPLVSIIFLAIMAGAQFIVANCGSDEVARMCNLYQIPYAPGCTTMTEANHSLEMGAAFIKCFPISNVYGPELVNLFKTPTPWMPLMASGGINLDNLAEWLERGVDCCGMGSLLTKGSKEEIAANAAKVRAIIDETRAKMQTA